MAETLLIIQYGQKCTHAGWFRDDAWTKYWLIFQLGNVILICTNVCFSSFVYAI